MGIGNVFKIDDRYINIDRLSIIGDNGDHSPNFPRQTPPLLHEWLAERLKHKVCSSDLHRSSVTMGIIHQISLDRRRRCPTSG